jgi:hypothetical protein
MSAGARDAVLTLRAQVLVITMNWNAEFFSAELGRSAAAGIAGGRRDPRSADARGCAVHVFRAIQMIETRDIATVRRVATLTAIATIPREIDASRDDGPDQKE